jgi:putative transposase
VTNEKYAVIVHVLIAVGVTADGQREVLGLDVVSGEDGAGWLAFLRALVARGLSGVALAIGSRCPWRASSVPRSASPATSWVTQLWMILDGGEPAGTSRRR